MRTLDTIEHRWQRRLCCLTVLPMITVLLVACAVIGSLVASWEAGVEYWNR